MLGWRRASAPIIFADFLDSTQEDRLFEKAGYGMISPPRTGG
jgi:hypothetical protein